MKNFKLLFVNIQFLLFFSFFLFSFNSKVFALSMGISGSQSATISATSGSPIKFYDNGGSAVNYSNSIASATYTFNCAAGKYIRIKINTLDTESSLDLFSVYDGGSTASRLIGEKTFSGYKSTAYMYVATTGSLTVKFTSDGSLNYAGWDADVWVDNSPGQVWDGSTSTEVSTASNWEGDILPYNAYTSIYIPSGLTNYPLVSDASSSLSIYDLRIQSGGTLNYSATSTGPTISIYGSVLNDGVFNKTSTLYVNFEGGTSSNYATISGSGDFSTVSIGLGLNRVAYYKLSNSILSKSFKLNSVNGNSMFDMNGFDFSVYNCTIEASTTFYQRTGILRIDFSVPTIDNTSFNENTGTTYFSRGTTWAAGNQTVPSITYYNLKIRTNNTFVATIGDVGTTTVTNDLTFLNPGTAGGSASSAYDIVCNGNVYLGNTDNALTLNLGNRITRTTSSGTTSFTMGNNDAHIVNVTYADASLWSISLGASAATSNLTFYGTVNYNSANAQKVMANSYKNLTILGVGSRSLTAATTVSNNLTISAGTLTAGAAYDLNVGGTWSNSGAYSHTNGTVTLNGTANQSIAGSITTSFYNLTNSNSSSGLTLNRGILVSNNLTMSGATANIYLNGFDIDLSSTGTLVGESNSDRIYGTSGVITTTRVFSAGVSALNIAGLGLELTTSVAMGSTLISRGHNALTGSTLTNVILRYFIITPTVNTNLAATLTMNYYDNELNGLTSSESSFKLYRSTNSGSTWTKRNGTENTAGNFISLNPIAAFSHWTISPDDIIALPILLTKFNGKNEGLNKNVLTWETSSEINNDFFTVEKSVDGINFEGVGIENGAGNSNCVNSYVLINSEYRNEINYYRLKQTDFNGQFSYSDIIIIDNRNLYKSIVKIINLIGQEVDESYKGAVIIQYSDNSILRTFQNF